MKALSAALALATAGASACPPDGPVQATWRSEPAKVLVGQPFRLIVTLCPARSTLKAVDATMPAHRHGMNYRPKLKALGGGRFQVDGLLWHMSGHWELRFDTELDGTKQVLRQDVQLP